MAHPPPRVAIIGLDGADWTLLRRLMRDGVMPTLKAFVDQSASGTLESVLPTNSMSAWTSMMTGVNPGKHGVFDFVRTSRTPFQTLVTNSTHIRYPTLGETLTSAGLSSCFIDMPPFHPPFDIDGVMLGGIGALDPARLASSPDVSRVIEEAGGYADDVPWLQYGGRDAEFEAALGALTDNRVRLAQGLLGYQPFDLFCLVIVTPDRAQHALWKDAIQDGPRRSMAERVYRAIDDALGRLLELIDTRETDVLLVSDHGFRAVNQMVGVNEVLASAGLARSLHIPALERLAVAFLQKAPLPVAVRRRGIQTVLRGGVERQRSLAPDSRTYSDAAESVSVNLAGRETTGTVAPGDLESVLAQTTAALLEFEDPATGVRPVRDVLRRDEYVHGDFAGEAADLMLEFSEGYAYSGLPGRALREWPPLQGVHRREGIIACAGPRFRRAVAAPEHVSILDIAPTALALLGLAPTEGTDGHVAAALLSDAVSSESLRPVPSGSQVHGRSYTEQDEERVKERLRGLGYIE